MLIKYVLQWITTFLQILKYELRKQYSKATLEFILLDRARILKMIVQNSGTFPHICACTIFQIRDLLNCLEVY